MEPTYAQQVAALVKQKLDRLFDLVDVIVLADDKGRESVQATVCHRQHILGLTAQVLDQDIAAMKDAAGYINVLASLLARRFATGIMETEV